MAPGPFSGLLAPFIGARKSKKYEKLQTEDPEKKRQEATQDEINRLHSKIVSLYLFDTHGIMPCPSAWTKYFLSGTKSDLYKTNQFCP